MRFVRPILIFAALTCSSIEEAAAEIAQITTNGCTISINDAAGTSEAEFLEDGALRGLSGFLEAIGEMPLWVAGCLQNTTQFRVASFNCAWGCRIDLTQVILVEGQTALFKRVSYRSHSSDFRRPGEKARYDVTAGLLAPDDLHDILHRADSIGLWGETDFPSTSGRCADASSYYLEIAKPRYYRLLSHSACGVPRNIAEFIDKLTNARIISNMSGSNLMLGLRIQDQNP